MITKSAESAENSHFETLVGNMFNVKLNLISPEHDVIQEIVIKRNNLFPKVTLIKKLNAVANFLIPKSILDSQKWTKKMSNFRFRKLFLEKVCL
jgi:hypothetical protein